jgi:hypothetical protein
MAVQDTLEREDLVHVVVNCRACELAIVLVTCLCDL